MKPLIVVLAGLSSILGVSWSSAQDTREMVRLRALGPHLSESVIAFIAKNASTFRVSPGELLGATPLTARDVINRHCGGLRDAYWSAFLELNKPKTFLLDDPLGDQAEQLEWPACLYVSAPSGGYATRTRPREYLIDVYKRLTGGGGGDAAVQHFFRRSNVNPTALSVGTKVIGNHVTRPVELIPQMKREAFLNEVTRLASENGRPAAEMVIELTAADVGTVIVAAGDETGCEPVVDAEGLFNAKAVSLAYKFTAIRTGFQTAKVVIVDNGFFGANPRNSKGKEFDGSPFPKMYFTPEDRYVVARQLPLPGEGRFVYAINYFNDFTTADFESGHGTHVAGLVLGGPTFKTYRDSLRPAGGAPWTEITIINLGMGQRTLIPGAERLLHAELAGEGFIVNMSITYDRNAYINLSSTFDDLLKRSANLYVVAAGNDYGKEVAFDIYPAGRGGLHLPNVVTVAALDNTRRFTRFSNTGADSVDLAAPGCEVKSWIENKEEETPLSGTSQAAPLVTFAAALLRSISDGAEIKNLKSRLIVSGDLLHREDQEYTAFRVALNIPKALYLLDDYVKIRGEGEFLGAVDKVSGLRCRWRTNQIDRNDLWTFKRGALKNWVYLGKPLEVQKPCETVEDRSAKVQFTAVHRITPDGIVPVPENERARLYRLDQVDEIVFKMPK